MILFFDYVNECMYECMHAHFRRKIQMKGYETVSATWQTLRVATMSSSSSRITMPGKAADLKEKVKRASKRRNKGVRTFL